MGYNENCEGYEIICKIEIGLRELLIHVIKKNGINNWFQTFMSGVQRDNISTISQRIIKAKNNEELPNIEDQYVYKMTRALQENLKSKYKNTLYHPFYYLDWTDLSSLFRFKPNKELLNSSFGADVRVLIPSTLESLNLIRNNVMHARFIEESDLAHLKGVFQQLEGQIPDFLSFTISQSNEDNPEYLLNELTEVLLLFQRKKALNLVSLDKSIITLALCQNSFWLNSNNQTIIPDLQKLIDEAYLYKGFLNKPGGLFEILEWRKRNDYFFKTFEQKLDD
jgi:hypothetical protein